jgi:hypothetical protein
MQGKEAGAEYLPTPFSTPNVLTTSAFKFCLYATEHVSHGVRESNQAEKKDGGI